MNPVDVVQRQLEAYNRRDLEAFCELFAEDAQIFDLGATVPTFTGKEAIRTRYRELFDRSPTLHSNVLTRTALGRVVVDLEHITGRNGSPGVFAVLAIYEVDAGKIQRVHFARP
jgi:uncharacterized protein (TIGR02246 family)